jgi:hypothetical protein
MNDRSKIAFGPGVARCPTGAHLAFRLRRRDRKARLSRFAGAVTLACLLAAGIAEGLPGREMLYRFALDRQNRRIASERLIFSNNAQEFAPSRSIRLLSSPPSLLFFGLILAEPVPDVFGILPAQKR